MSKAEIVVLGGGPAGLAAAYYAQKKKKNFLLIEAAQETGGNCRTIRHGDFYFDTGAHRFHDKDPEVTEEIKKIMGSDLTQVEAPSQIWFKGSLVDFPLSPYDLLQKLSFRELYLAGSQLLKNSFSSSKKAESFEDFALHTYGKFIAENFLLNYSEKLWGLPCKKLSVNVSGKRLKGLDLKTFLIEGVAGKKVKTRHLDGAFYYPKKGFGDIMKRLESTLPPNRIRTNARVTEIIADNNRIQKIVVNNKEEIEADTFVNSLPLSLTLKMMGEDIPGDIAETAASLQYRHLLLAVFILNKESFSPNASIYFPGKDIPFTRIYEPKNRSRQLAPQSKTCIVVEIPFQNGDEYPQMTDEVLRKTVEAQLCAMSLLKESEVLDFVSYKIPFAYPVLETGFEAKAKKLLDYLSRYSNMHLSGRSALFSYSHLHDQMKWAQKTMDKL